jgi:uncharacterized membrane protein YdjX (TVP38/TMEM64 family)
VTGARDDRRGCGTERGGRRGLWRYAPLVLIALGAGAFFASGAHRYLTPEALVENRDRLKDFVADHRGKALLAYMLAYVALVTLSIPGSVFLTLLGGFLFGWLVGGAAAVMSATTGAIGIFLIARTSVGDALLRRAGTRIQRLAEGFRRDAFSYLLFVRIVPIIPFWLTNLASALFGVPLRTFALATMLGLIPATCAFAVAGSGLDDILTDEIAARQGCLAAGAAHCPVHLSWKSLITPPIVAAFGALGLLALLPVILRRLFGERFRRFAGERVPGRAEP